MSHSPNHQPAPLHLIVLAGICAATAALRADPARAQSFDCRQVRYQDEMRICQEPELARLDQQLAMVYREQIGKISKERQDEFQRHETFFLNARHRCGGNYRCLEQSYRNRIKELEDALSEARLDETGTGTSSAASETERPSGPRGDWSSRSEGSLEGSNSGDGAPTSEHYAKRSRSTRHAPTIAVQPHEALSGSTSEPAPAKEPASTDDAPAKPAVRWVDPPPAR